MVADSEMIQAAHAVQQGCRERVFFEDDIPVIYNVLERVAYAMRNAGFCLDGFRVKADAGAVCKQYGFCAKTTVIRWGMGLKTTARREASRIVKSGTLAEGKMVRVSFPKPDRWIPSMAPYFVFGGQTCKPRAAGKDIVWTVYL